MTLNQFFFDTADEKLVAEWWAKLQQTLSSHSVAGVTTNPSALQKEGVKTMKELQRKLWDLSEVLYHLSPGGNPKEIYVQLPNDNMHTSDVIEFAKFLKKTNEHIGTHVRIGLKVPPYDRILQLAPRLRDLVDLNVTGVADCSTALKAFSYPVKYVSIIPGRMEEKGLNAKAHVGYAQQRSVTSVHGHPGRLITGSMRTLEGLKWVIAYGTVPTIGWRVWDQIFDKEKNPTGIQDFRDYWTCDPVRSNFAQSPVVLDHMTKLSEDFFIQMNECGKELHEDFEKVIIL